MPNQLMNPRHHGLNCGKGTSAIDFRFEPLPEALNWMVVRRVRGEMFKHHPVMLLEELFDYSAGVNRGMIENEHQERLRKTLVQLMSKRHEHFRDAALGSFPIKPLGAQMESPEQSRSLTLGKLWSASLFAFTKPAPMDIGLMGKVRLIQE